MKQMVDFFAVVERLRVELISKWYYRSFYRFRIRLRIRNSGLKKKKKIRNYSGIRNYSEMDIPSGGAPRIWQRGGHNRGCGGEAPSRQRIFAVFT